MSSPPRILLTPRGQLTPQEREKSPKLLSQRNLKQLQNKKTQKINLRKFLFQSPKSPSRARLFSPVSPGVGQSEYTSIPMTSQDFPFPYLNALLKHRPTYWPLWSTFTPLPTMVRLVLSDTPLFIKYTIFGSNINPLQVLFSFLPTTVCTWSNNHFSCTLLKAIWLTPWGTADWIGMYNMAMKHRNSGQSLLDPWTWNRKQI